MYVPAHIIFFLMKKGEDATQPQLSHLVNDFLQELCHLSLGTGGSGAYSETVSPAWSLAKFAEFGRMEGQGDYGLGYSILLVLVNISAMFVLSKAPIVPSCFPVYQEPCCPLTTSPRRLGCWGNSQSMPAIRSKP